MIGMYKDQFAPWRPNYTVVPRSEFMEDSYRNKAIILAASIIINSYIKIMIGKSRGVK